MRPLVWNEFGNAEHAEAVAHLERLAVDGAFVWVDRKVKGRWLPAFGGSAALAVLLVARLEYVAMPVRVAVVPRRRAEDHQP